MPSNAIAASLRWRFVFGAFMQLSPNFTLDEFTASQIASRFGIDNTPDEAALRFLRSTAARMERVRTLLGDKPIRISSGFRCPALNKKAGGSPRSAHMFGLAADFTCPAFGSPYAVAKCIADSVLMSEVDQLILEFDAWVHIGFSKGKPRRELLTVRRIGSGAVTLDGLLA